MNIAVMHSGFPDEQSAQSVSPSGLHFDLNPSKINISYNTVYTFSACSSALMHCYNIVCADSVHIWISTKASAPYRCCWFIIRFVYRKQQCAYVMYQSKFEITAYVKFLIDNLVTTTYLTTQQTTQQHRSCRLNTIKHMHTKCTCTVSCTVLTTWQTYRASVTYVWRLQQNMYTTKCHTHT